VVIEIFKAFNFALQLHPACVPLVSLMAESRGWPLVADDAEPRRALPFSSGACFSRMAGA